MKRRSFLTRLFGAGVSAVAAPFVLKAAPAAPKPIEVPPAPQTLHFPNGSSIHFGPVVESGAFWPENHWDHIYVYPDFSEDS